MALLVAIACTTVLGTVDGLPQPILSSCPCKVSFFTVASAWKAAAVAPSKKEMKTHDFSGNNRTDSTGPKRTRFMSSSTFASGERTQEQNASEELLSIR